MKTILIVDDSASNIAVLAQSLRDDYKIIIAKSGRQALDSLARQALPDLILLDVVMPEMDGFEVCRRLKADPKTRDIPIIFITAKSEIEDETCGLDLGAVDYIVKPISPPVVKARVRTHLSLRSARQQLERQNHELLKAAKLQQDVERMARHDLKSPLQIILNAPQLMKLDPALPSAHLETLDAVEDAAYCMLRMINLSLDLFKMEKGIYRFCPCPIDLIPIFKRIRHENSHIATQRGISLVIHINGKPAGPGAVFTLQGEELLCYVMLGNLIKNAFEASPAGGAVTIDLIGSQNVSIITIHNAKPVPESICEAFFDKYVTCGKPSGTGLGTYCAKLIAETQRGKISMTTSEPKGTTINLTFPNSTGQARSPLLP